MTKRDIKARIAQLGALGVSSADIFLELRGLAYSDLSLALLLASRPAPYRCAAHKGKVRFMTAVAILQAMLGFFVGWQIAYAEHLPWPLAIAAVTCALPTLTAIGFIRNHLAAYNLYIAVSLVQYALQVRDIIDGYSAAWVGVLLSSLMLTFVIYLRMHLFPGVGVFLPKKDKNGNYVFC